MGFGHLARCLVLADEARVRGLEPEFLLYADADGAERVKQASYECTVRQLDAIEAAVSDRDLADDSYDVAVADLSHPRFFRSPEIALLSLSRIRAHSKRLVLVDALAGQSISARIPNLPVDAIAMPYVGAPSLIQEHSQTISGPRYAVVGSSYRGTEPRTIRESANRVLVTCGGSDPTGLSAVVFDALETIQRKLVVRVVVGPLFSDALKKTLSSLSAASNHEVSFVESPADLAGHMLWCDVAVAASGLTKYELASTGTPAVLISLGDSDHAVNSAFAKIGCSVDLGAMPAPEEIAESVAELLASSERRDAMARTGRAVVDGRGAERLITEIMGSRFATE